ncbi:hypothetical protein SAICODRAFT_5583 [Saitoella complicata NRRL Y-17804]|nr:uncharacterized protein SAICODRAFT_5583 [Saitoella complicata NRRL Y-17804]ODQ54962.1 hypothetical protein SAICODRAFT_5583 [Saitoella complicata NRRL Y-17804]
MFIPAQQIRYYVNPVRLGEHGPSFVKARAPPERPKEATADTKDGTDNIPPWALPFASSRIDDVVCASNATWSYDIPPSTAQNDVQKGIEEDEPLSAWLPPVPSSHRDDAVCVSNATLSDDISSSATSEVWPTSRPELGPVSRVATLWQNLAKRRDGSRDYDHENIDHLWHVRDIAEDSEASNRYTTEMIVSKIGSLYRRGQVSMIPALFEEYLQEWKGVPDTHVVMKVINSRMRLGDTHSLGEFVLRLVDRGFIPGTGVYNLLLKTLIKNHNMLAALEFLRVVMIPMGYEDERTYQLLMRGYLQLPIGAKASRKVQDVFNSMQRAGIGIIPSVTTYNILCAAYFRDGDEENARKVLRDMTSRGIQPNVRTYAILIQAEATLGRWEEAKKTFRTLDAMGISGSMHVETYNSLLKAPRQLLQDAEFTEIYEDMKKRGVEPNMNTMIIRLKRLLCLRDMDGVEALFKEMTDMNLQSAQNQRSLSEMFTRLLLHVSKPGTETAFVETLQLYEGIGEESRHLIDHVGQNIVLDCIRRLRGDRRRRPFDVPQRWATTMLRLDYSLQFRSLFLHGSYYQVLKLYEELLSWNVPLTMGVVQILVQGFLRMGREDIALDIVKKNQPATHLDSVVLRCIMISEFVNGKTYPSEEDQTLFVRNLDKILADTNLVTYTAVASTLLKMGQAKMALDVLHRHRKEYPDEKWDLAAYAVLSKAYRAMYDFEGMLGVAAAVLNTDIKPNGQFIRNLKGDLSKATGTMDIATLESTLAKVRAALDERRNQLDDTLTQRMDADLKKLAVGRRGSAPKIPS